MNKRANFRVDDFILTDVHLIITRHSYCLSSEEGGLSLVLAELIFGATCVTGGCVIFLLLAVYSFQETMRFTVYLNIQIRLNNLLFSNYNGILVHITITLESIYAVFKRI